MDEECLGFRVETKRFGRKFYTKLLASILTLSLAATVLQVEAQIPLQLWRRTLNFIERFQLAKAFVLNDFIGLLQ
jgi:hypothetical protein